MLLLFQKMLVGAPKCKKHENFEADAADLDIDRFCYEWYRRALTGPNNGKKQRQNFWRVQRQKSKLRFLMA